MMDKRGELTTKEILEILLGAAVVFVLAVLLYSLISPGFDKLDETAESYFEAFEEVIDNGGGSFLLWQPEDKGKKFYLVYFKDKPSFDVDGRTFFSLSDHVNHVCVCYWDGKNTKCDYCKDLDLPLIEKGESEERWAVTIGQEIVITKKERFYEVVFE